MDGCGGGDDDDDGDEAINTLWAPKWYLYGHVGLQHKTMYRTGYMHAVRSTWEVHHRKS